MGKKFDSCCGFQEKNHLIVLHGELKKENKKCLILSDYFKKRECHVVEQEPTVAGQWSTK